MKRIFQFFHSATALLLMAIAVMVSACSESEENTPPPPPDPVVPSILMADSLVSVPAEGGSFAVEAKVANPVEGETLSADCHTTWVKDLRAEADSIYFNIEPNNAEEERATEIALAYKGADTLKLKVVQEAATNSFDLQAVAQDESTIVASIKPGNASLPYIVMILPQTEADAYGDDDDALFKDDMAYLKHQAEKLLITLDRMIEIHQRKGNVDLSFSNLSPSTSYCIYCYGLSAAGERLTPITKTTVKTKAPAGLDCNFDISYDSDGIEVTMNVKPSNPDTRYYFNMLQADLTDEEVMTKVMDYLGQLVSIYEMNGYTREQAIEALTFSGESSYTFTVLEPNSEYKGFAFALSPSGITGDMTTKNVKTGEPKASDNNITVEVFDIQPRQVSVRCTPSRLGERYVVTCAPLDYYGNMADDEVLPYLTQYLKNGNIQAVTGVFESDLTQLSPDTQYELLVVGVNGSYPSTKLFRERFTTKKEQQVDLHLKVEASKYYAAADAAKVYPDVFAPYANMAIMPVWVSADKGATTYYNIYEGDYTDPAIVSDDILIQNLVAAFTAERTDFLVNYDTDVTLVATACDAAGNFTSCHRQHFVLTRDGVSPIEEYDFPGIEQNQSRKPIISPLKTVRPAAASKVFMPKPAKLKKAAKTFRLADTLRDACKGPFRKNIMRRQLPAK